MERKTFKRLTAAGLISLGALSLAGCAEEHYNYEGAGNEFVVHGPVSDVEDDGTIHINEQQIVVDEVYGEATDWFKDGNGQNVFSDNFNFEPYFYENSDSGLFTCGEKQVEVGRVLNRNGQEISPQDLQPGTEVTIHGSIRDSRKLKSYGKTMLCRSEEYPVFDTVRIS